ncbi:MAG: glycosyltransferase [Candidatus Omnitrophica bacterium]|jgi:glycosyltransferase involved in cell wall biosynthesis|nr:glycosyltransferase [Candidatus Omnitrophota bacterium]
MKLSIIVPVYNEEENICEVIAKIEETVKIPHELLIVNDHSSDKTGELALSLLKDYQNLSVVDNITDKGFANALRFGFKSAKGDVFLPVMGDLCDDLNDIAQLYEKIKQGFDIACGSRYIHSGARKGGSAFKAFLSSFAGVSTRFLIGIPTSDITNAFKMYRKEVIDSITTYSRGFEISMEIPLKAYFMGYKITQIPTAWNERTKGKSNFKVFKLMPAYLKLYFWAITRRIKG